MKPLSEMTDVELSEAFAGEVAGWKIPSGCTNYRYRPDGNKVFFNPLTGDDPVPEYVTSLDSVMPHFQKMSKEKRGEFVAILCEMVGVDGDGWQHIELQKILLATPRQWCIALLEAKRRDGK